MNTTFSSLDRQSQGTVDYREAESVEGAIALGGAAGSIARGAGLSYVAASFGDQARCIGMRPLNRVLHLDAAKRLVTVEAGMALSELYDALVPHRLFLPIQPGHPQITIGGCVACNVHGKNPKRDGVFRQVVESLQLFHPARGVIGVSRDENSELFDLTCGGFGTTGIILAVTLRVSELTGGTVRVRNIMTKSLEHTMDAIDALTEDYDFLYTWNDMTTLGPRLGQGCVVVGNVVDGSQVSTQPLGRYWNIDPCSVKWWPRVWRYPISAFGSIAYYERQRRVPVENVPLATLLYPGMRAAFYFDLYGYTGFLAHVVLVPHDRARTYARKLEAVVRKHQQRAAMSSMKVFSGDCRYLTFNGRGYSMHFHIENTPGGRDLLAALEDLSRDVGARRNIYFDSRLDADSTRACYPEYDAFREKLHRFDPDRRFQSLLSRRIGL